MNQFRSTAGSSSSECVRLLEEILRITRSFADLNSSEITPELLEKFVAERESIYHRLGFSDKITGNSVVEISNEELKSIIREIQSLDRKISAQIDSVAHRMVVKIEELKTAALQAEKFKLPEATTNVIDRKI